jgi:1-deoxy-D-xylulose-5-phosphate reductoisomerase
MKYRPAAAALGNGAPGAELKKACRKTGCELMTGHEGVVKLAGLPESDMVVSAMVGSVGLEPALEALKAGKDIALANKEVMVAAGELVLSVAGKSGSKILPVDSEHNAIFQCLQGEERLSLVRVLLCASGGPFFEKDAWEFENITVKEALNHPRWDMGRKTTIDSATLMNKGLEMIEARWLFDLELDQIKVVIHPQAIVHSMVEFIDGSIIAQLSRTDMTIPVQYCLSYPSRWPSPEQKLELPHMSKLEFHEPDQNRFPSLALARNALETGGTMPAVLNAADEVAVEAFLNGRISFPTIMRVVAATMERHKTKPANDLGVILAVDTWARKDALQLVEKYAL